MAGVEFLGTDGVDDADVVTGPSPDDRRPGSAGRLIGLLAAALLTAGFVAWAAGDHPAGRPHGQVTTPTAAPQPSDLDIPGRWRVPGLRPSDPVAADAVTGQIYALSGGADLYSVGPSGGLLSYRRADTTHGRLAVDTVHHVVWVLPGDGEPAALEAYAATSLRTVAATYLHAPVSSGGVLDGRLYVTLRTSPAQLVPVDLLTSSVGPASEVPAGIDAATMAVDADNHRLVFLARAPGGRTLLWFWAPIGGWTRGESVAFAGAGVQALRNTLWVAGVEGRGAAAHPVLSRIEPDVLAPDLGRPDASRFTLVAGRFTLLVRDRTDGSAWCIDPETSEVVQRWSRTGAVLSTSSVILTTAADRLVPLDAGDCLG